MRQSIRVNSVRYCVYSYGQGDTLLVLHGFTGSAQTWTQQIPAFSRQFHVITPDLLGHAGTDSPSPPERYRIEPAAADMIALLDVWEIGRAHLLGYSMGGRLALHMAAHYPDRFASLTLESASPGLKSASPGLKTAEERTERRRRDEALADRIEREGVASFVEMWEALPLWHSQKHALSDQARQRLREERLAQQPRGLANSLRGMGTGAQPSLWDALAHVTMPVQLIAGKLDTKFVALNREMLAQLPDARLDVVSNSGHTVHLENPSAFEQIVLGFLTA
jgi:2-succinyl-6-hydroxy-2,4-cyclohexadiene-1-carboxylate synthase